MYVHACVHVYVSCACVVGGAGEGYVCVSVHECVRIGGQAAAGCLLQLLSLTLPYILRQSQ